MAFIKARCNDSSIVFETDDVANELIGFDAQGGKQGFTVTLYNPDGSEKGSFRVAPGEHLQKGLLKAERIASTQKEVTRPDLSKVTKTGFLHKVEWQ